MGGGRGHQDSEVAKDISERRERVLTVLSVTERSRRVRMWERPVDVSKRFVANLTES